MKKYLYLIFLLNAVISSAQITFQKIYDLGTGVSKQQTSDNGFILAVGGPDKTKLDVSIGLSLYLSARL